MFTLCIKSSLAFLCNLLNRVTRPLCFAHLLCDLYLDNELYLDKAKRKKRLTAGQVGWLAGSMR